MRLIFEVLVQRLRPLRLIRARIPNIELKAAAFLVERFLLPPTTLFLTLECWQGGFLRLFLAW